ncbi:MAG TPA: 2Fe-2S iron-sulfur cluster-binding protein [Methylovirgula sp.]|nr:2Fe-2S iron-sulfur cluster-binding protein [Methylovirgula sp.]
MSEAYLSRLLIFPVKSLDPLEVTQARVLSSGALERDRTFGLFDAEGKFVNGKRHAAIHALRSNIDFDAGTLSLRDNDKEQGEIFSLEDRGSIEAWLADYFGFPVFFRRNEKLGFPDDAESPGPTVISAATLEEIGRWFGLAVEEVRARFRTNIEIGGVPAFWEDRLFGPAGTLVRFRIGEALFQGINPCQRCVVPPRNPLTGRTDETFVRRFAELRARTLPEWSTRARFDHFYRVAINTRPDGEAGGKLVRVGDPIEILEPRMEPSGAGKINESSDFWAGELVVDAVRDETPSVKTFRLRHPSKPNIPFRFLPGQFVTVTIGTGKSALQRCYTLSSSPAETAYCEITVKREGAAWSLLHDRVKAGSRLGISGPMGRFTFDGQGAEEIVLIAGGVGITPLMSKIRFLAANKWQGRIDLLYSVKTSRDVIFAQELAELQRLFPALRLHLTLTAADEEWTGARGRLSAEWISARVPDIASRRVHLCGPTAMAGSVQQILHQLGVPASNIEIEAFGGNRPAREGEAREIRFVRSGRTATASATLLEAALAAGIAIDHGCRAGVCGRCKMKLLEGEVAVDFDLALTPEEKAEGLILACQAHALGPVALDC